MSPEPSLNKIGKSVGEKIRVARVALRYTQSQLATPDFSVSYISAIERGQIHPSLRALEILAGRLGLASTELLPKRPAQDSHHLTTPPQPEREDDEGEMVLLEVQMCLSQNEAEKAIALLTKTSAKRLKRPQQLWHRYLLGCAYFMVGRLHTCEHIFSELVQSVNDVNNHYLHTHILFMHGNTFAAMQNPTQALLTHQLCLNVLEGSEVRNAFLIATVSVQLGSHYVALEQSEEALNMFHKALTTLEEFDTAKKAHVLYKALTQHAIANQDYYASTLYAHQSLLRSKREMQEHLKADLYHYLGQALIKGDQEEAYGQLKAMEENVRSHSLLKASITARIAEWHLTHQNMTEARQHAEEAYILSRPFQETVITADALLLLARIEYAQEAFDSGDEHFVQGLSMLEHLQRQVELAEQSILYAQLLETRGRDREAFTYLRLAYQSRI